MREFSRRPIIDSWPYIYDVADVSFVILVISKVFT